MINLSVCNCCTVKKFGICFTQNRIYGPRLNLKLTWKISVATDVYVEGKEE